jgi:hypothetical protein
MDESGGRPMAMASGALRVRGTLEFSRSVRPDKQGSSDKRAPTFEYRGELV